MAKTPTKVDATATEAVASTDPVYTEVRLSRPVEIEGHRYLPGRNHVVDESVLAALGDAVATQRKIG